jgi:uncharacterized protein YdhG (YjbR/CyaY superfamily)
MNEIDDYLASLEEPQRRALERVRDIAQRVAPSASQGKSYGLPALRIAGKPLLGFNVSSQHLSVHPFSSAVVAAVAEDLEGFSLSKGTIRFTPESPLPETVIERLVRLRLTEITGS